MRSSVVAGVLLACFIAAAAGEAAAQAADAGVPSALRLPRLAVEAEGARRASLQDRVLTALGGALLGAGAGFFASQVLIGDWDERTIDRPAWAAIGGSVGFAISFSFPFSPKPGMHPVRREDRQPQIGAAEIQRTSASNAYEAVSALRPQWLIPRGTHVIGETPAETIRVYLDGNELGGVAALKLVSATTIASIHFLEPAAASLRWGAGHSHGAILVIGN